MMLEIALARPEYAPTARNTRLIDISALDYYGKGYADIPARAAVDQEHHGGARTGSRKPTCARR